MADLRNEATYKGIAGRRWSPHTEPKMPGTLLGWLASILTSVGGNVSAAARLVDVPRRTMRDWLVGATKPRADRIGRVQAVAGQVHRAAVLAERRKRLVASREARIRRARSIRIEGVDRYDEELRDVTFIRGTGDSTGLDASTFDELVRAYLDGANAIDEGRSTPGLFSRILDGMTDDWYRGFFADAAPDWGCDVHTVTIR